jgi:hypothetical protein
MRCGSVIENDLEAQFMDPIRKGCSAIFLIAAKMGEYYKE